MIIYKYIIFIINSNITFYPYIWVYFIKFYSYIRIKDDNIMFCKMDSLRRGPKFRIIEDIIVIFNYDFTITIKINKNRKKTLINLIKAFEDNNRKIIIVFNEIKINFIDINKDLIKLIENYNTNEEIINLKLVLNYIDWSNELNYMILKYIENEPIKEFNKRTNLIYDSWENSI